MRKVVIIAVSVLGGLAVLAAVIVGLVFWFTGGAVDAADNFLALIGQQRIEEAYQSTAAGLRAQQDAASFAGAVKTIGLTRYQSASWSNREIQNNRATLEGSVTTTDGGTIPLTVTLVGEGDDWKVIGLSSPMAGAAIARTAAESSPAAPAAPAAAPAERADTAPATSPAADAAAAEKAPAAVSGEGGAAYTIVENPDLTGRLGRIIVTFPQGSSPSSTRVEVHAEGAKETNASNYGGLAADLFPGKYDVVISGVVVQGVEVRSRSDSNVAVGVLRVSAGSSTRIEVFKGQQEVASGYGKAQFGLPAGAYEVQISGKREPITIAPGAAVDF